MTWLTLQIDLINGLVLFVSVMTLLSGVLIYTRGQANATKAGYLGVTFCLFLWGLSSVFFRSAPTDADSFFWVRWLYFIPPLVPLSYIYLSDSISTVRPDADYQKLSSTTKISLFVVIAGVTAYLCFGSEGLIRASKTVGGQISFSTFEYGVYLATIFLGWAVAFWQMYRQYLAIKRGEVKKGLYLFILGTFISTTIAICASIILPFFGLFYLNWIGQAAVMIMVLMMFYAVLRYNVINTKVITAEIFTYGLALVLFARIFYANTETDFYINLISLVVIALFGYFFTRSVTQEMRAKEELGTLADRLAGSNELLKKKDEQKSKMLSIASHQFRAPLTAIKGYTSLIRDGSYGSVSKEIREPIDRIYKSSTHLARIVNDFLNISRIEDGRMHYDFEVVDVEPIIRSVAEEAEAVLSDAVTIVVEIDDAENHVARIDRDKFEQVVSNLIDNAIKYTESGDISVKLQKEDGMIHMAVCDDGIGIKEEDIETIFDQFVRAKEANEVNVIGSGLGLYIAKQIIADHDGEIWATSAGLGKGATFHVQMKSAKA